MTFLAHGIPLAPRRKKRMWRLPYRDWVDDTLYRTGDHVSFGPTFGLMRRSKATCSITSSARESSDGGASDVCLSPHSDSGGQKVTATSMSKVRLSRLWPT